MFLTYEYFCLPGQSFVLSFHHSASLSPIPSSRQHDLLRNVVLQEIKYLLPFYPPLILYGFMFILSSLLFFVLIHFLYVLKLLILLILLFNFNIILVLFIYLFIK